jgi:hypothetical protein
MMSEAKKHPGGRPLKYETPEELQIAIEEYFNQEVIDEKPLTITGLALFLGFESRQSIYDYEKQGKFSYTIKRARLRIEHYAEMMLFTKAPAGAIFALKNYGWSDRQEIDFNDVKKPDMSRYTKEELKQLAELSRKSRS